MAKLKMNINDPKAVRDLLEEVYNLAETQIVQAQNEINKLANATDLTQLTMDEKQKYAKAINDYLMVKDKAISKKIDVSKILTEILHHNGSKEGAEGVVGGIPADIDFSEIKRLVDDSYNEKEKTKVIEINKK